MFGARFSDSSELEKGGAHHQILNVAVVDQYTTAVGEIDEGLQGTENETVFAIINSFRVFISSPTETIFEAT